MYALCAVISDMTISPREAMILLATWGSWNHQYLSRTFELWFLIQSEQFL